MAREEGRKAEREEGFVTVARVGEVAPGQARQVTVANRWVGLFNLDGEYPRDRQPLPPPRRAAVPEGCVSAGVVTCPWHGWQFDVRTGACVQDSVVGVTRHDVRIVGDEIQVALSD